LAQDILPMYIWVVEFRSASTAGYESIVDGYIPKFADVDVTLSFVKSEVNFKNYGCFQFGLQAWTEYVWILHEGIIPGPKMLGLYTHILNIPELRAGVLGSTGWIGPPLNETTYKFGTLRGEGSLYIDEPSTNLFQQLSPSKLLKVDMLSSQYFLRTDHIKLTFRDKVVLSKVSDGLMIGYSMRRYANLESYVIPILYDDPTTWGNVDVVSAFAKESKQEQEYRLRSWDNMWWDLAVQGGQFFWLQYRQYQQQLKVSALSKKYAILVFIDGVDEALALKNIHSFLQKNFQSRSSVEVFTVITGGVRGPCKTTLAQLNLIPTDEWCSGRRYGLFDLKWGQSHDRKESEALTYMDMLAKINSVLDVVGAGQSIAMLAALDDIHAENAMVKRALEEVARQRSFHYVGLTIPETQAPTAALTALSSVESIDGWKEPTVTIIYMHLESDPEVNQDVLDSLAESYFFGNSANLIVVGSQDSNIRDIFEDFRWKNGRKTLVLKNRVDSWIDTALEAYYPNTSDEFIIMLDSKNQLDPSFFISVKASARQLLSGHNPSSLQNFFVCLTQPCKAPYFAVSGYKWKEVFQTCSDLQGNMLSCETVWSH